MAEMGPAVGLLLFGASRRSAAITAEVLPWLESFCTAVEVSSDDGSADFWVGDPAALGLRGVDITGAGVFGLSEDDQIPAEDEDYSALPSPPVQALVLDAARSAPVNHLLLGRTALLLARRLDALIDFDGMLKAADLPSLPGRLMEISYDEGDGVRGYRHVADPEFLAAWVRHPEFHLPD